MAVVKILDKTFKTSIPEAEIKKHVKEVADRINHDMEGKNPLLLAVLNGSFIFAADLMRMITIPCEISFVKLASYEGTTSTGKITEVIGINEDLTDRTVIIVEDIVDTGLTMKRMVETLGTRNPASIHICTLLVKPDKLKVDLNIEYAAMSIPNDYSTGLNTLYHAKRSADMTYAAACALGNMYFILRQELIYHSGTSCSSISFSKSSVRPLPLRTDSIILNADEGSSPF